MRALFTSLSIVDSPAGARISTAVFAAVTIALTLWVILRIGLLAAVVMFFVEFVLDRLPLTLDPNRLYFASGWATMAAVAALAAMAFWMARAGEPLFGRGKAVGSR